MNKKGKKELRLLDKIIIYLVILIALFALLGLFIRNANSDYSKFKDNKNYFKVNNDYEVQEWMNPQTILRHFPITENDLFNILNVSKTEQNLRTPLREICIKQKKDCNKVILDLNALLKR